MAHLYCLYQQINANSLYHFQNALFIYVSLERLSYLLKCYLYLEGTYQVCLLLQKYLLGNICHESKCLQTQNTTYFLVKEKCGIHL